MNSNKIIFSLLLIFSMNYAFSDTSSKERVATLELTRAKSATIRAKNKKVEVYIKSKIRDFEKSLKKRRSFKEKDKASIKRIEGMIAFWKDYSENYSAKLAAFENKETEKYVEAQKKLTKLIQIYPGISDSEWVDPGYEMRLKKARRKAGK